jgi:hypothetical protein
MWVLSYCAFENKSLNNTIGLEWVETVFGKVFQALFLSHVLIQDWYKNNWT